MDKLARLEPIRHYADTEDLIAAHNRLIEVINALADVVQTQGQMIDTLARPLLRIASTDPRQTHVIASTRDANPL